MRSSFNSQTGGGVLNFLLLNLNNLGNKVNALVSLSADSEFNVICVSETWLKPTINTATVNIPGYSFYRNDSPSGIGKHGVGIYLRQDLKIS